MVEPTIKLHEDLRRRIAAARYYAHGMSQDKLGKAIGVGRMTIVRTENGARDDARKEIPVRELQEIARVTDLPLEFLLPDPAAREALPLSMDDRVAALETQVAGLISLIGQALSPEQLEAEQRQFLEDWQRRSQSTSAEGEPGTSTQEEG